MIHPTVKSFVVYHLGSATERVASRYRTLAKRDLVIRYRVLDVCTAIQADLISGVWNDRTSDSSICKLDPIVSESDPASAAIWNSKLGASIGRQLSSYLFGAMSDDWVTKLDAAKLDLTKGTD